MSEYLDDIRQMPKRFWDAYLVTLVFVAALVFVVSQGDASAIVLVGLLTAFGVFSGMRIAYGVGRIKAYREVQGWVNEASQSISDGQSELHEAMRRLDALSKHFEGPS